MNALWVCWRAEWRLMARNRSLALVAATIALLTMAAVWSGAGWVRFQREALTQLRDTARAQHATYKRDAQAYLETHDAVDAGAPQHPVSVYWKRTYAWRDPAPSAVLRIGQSDVYPYYSVFHGVEEQVLHYAAEIKNPVHLLIGKLDASFLAIYVLPLILITLVYDLLSAERESGRLALVQGHGTSLVSWLTSRLALRWLLVVGWFAVCLVAALAATEPAVLATPAVLQFVGLVALYLAFWGGLALAINMRGWSSAVNALGLAASWIVFVFAYPTLVDSVASTVYRVPSRNQQALEDMRVRAEVDADRPRYLEQYLRDRPELRVQAPTERRPVQVYDWYPAFLTYQIAVDELTAGTEHAIREELMARERLAAQLRYASPALVLQGAIDRLAGVGVADMLAFDDRVDAFRDAWLATIRGYLFRNEFLDVEDFDRLPAFDAFAPPPIGPRWREFFVDLAWLVLLCIGLAWVVVRPPRRRRRVPG